MATTTARQLVSAPDACRLAGISYRQLDYWCRNGVIIPAQDARGSGTRRRFTLEQVRQLIVAGELADRVAGSKIEVLARAVEALDTAALLGIMPAFVAVGSDSSIVAISDPQELYDLMAEDASVLLVRVPDVPAL